MGVLGTFSVFLFYALFALCTSSHFLAFELENNRTVHLIVDALPDCGQRIPETLFGIFFEEINHAGAGGLWAELVSNRGFEAGGLNTPSNIEPWSIIGNESYIIVSTDLSSCFERNKVALKIDVLCDSIGSNTCPAGGVGVYNPGYWGMNIEEGKAYKVVLHVRSLNTTNIVVALTSSDGSEILASSSIIDSALDMSSWKKVELQLVSKGTDRNSRLQLTTATKGVLWFDQVSVMPLDTYKGHGFRGELVSMLADLKPRFIRFPGGCFVEGEWLRNAFRWRETIGPWEERPGHFGDVWKYWTDNGLGFFEFFQLAEDLGASPIWVFNNGISHQEQVASASILPFVKDILNGLEFARGAPTSKWGSVRAAMGHLEPFRLDYIAIGNEDCGKMNYRGNYLKFYYAIKVAYPDIKIISNCDGSSHQLDHPADIYDFHIYTDANSLFWMTHKFDHTSRSGPKAFISEYAVNGEDGGTGSLFAALAEAGFLIGLERNSEVVQMASYAPLFVNANDRKWNPDAIVFNSWKQYGTPSYWVQQFFKESSGAIIFPVTIIGNSSSLAASAITWQSPEDDSYLKIKIVNFGGDAVNLTMSVFGLQISVKPFGSIQTLLTSTNLMDENSFEEPNKVVPKKILLTSAGNDMEVVLLPYSLTSYDLLLAPAEYRYSI